MPKQMMVLRSVSVQEVAGEYVEVVVDTINPIEYYSRASKLVKSFDVEVNSAFRKNYIGFNLKEETKLVYNYLEVDWGDGSSKIVSTNPAQYNGMLEHSYPLNQGKFILKIKASGLKVLNFGISGNTASRISNINYFQLPELEHFEYGFGGFTFFANLPNRLFSKSPKLKNIDYSFRNSICLESIPGDIFENCANVEKCAGLFWECGKLKNISSGIFDSFSKVKSFLGVFEGAAIESIPVGLLKNCANAESFQQLFSYNALKSIPSDLFSNSLKADNFESAFASNEQLESIPDSLFNSQLGKSINLSGCFSSSPSLVEAPAFWNKFPSLPVEKTKYCFFNCSLASNYAQIPANWK